MKTAKKCHLGDFDEMVRRLKSVQFKNVSIYFWKNVHVVYKCLVKTNIFQSRTKLSKLEENKGIYKLEHNIQNSYETL